ncbi:hypothetical protein RCH19_001243 [Flavobacterium sp. PL12]
MFSTNIFGQSLDNEVKFYFEADTVKVTQGKTFTNFLYIKNLSKTKMKISSLIASANYPGILLMPKTPSVIGIGETEKIFVKFIASTPFMKMSSNEIKFELSYSLDDEKSKTIGASFQRKINEEEDVIIYPITQENYINPLIPESTISLFVENTGYASRSVQLQFDSDFAGLKLLERQIILNLEGKEKKTVELKLSMRQQNVYFPNYNIQVKVTDVNKNKVINVNTIKIMVLSNSTQLMRNSNVATDKNYMELAYNQLSSGFDYTQLRANTQINLGNEIRGTFNTAFDYYNSENKFSLYDTYLDIERKGSSIRLGNIYGNDYDYSVSGRGAKILANLGSKRNLEVLAVDNNYNIYSTYTTGFESSKTIGAKYSFGDYNSFNGKISYLFDHDPRLSIDSQIMHYSSGFQITENHNFRIETGLSHEQSALNDNKEAGFMSSINYDYRDKRWDLNSLSNFASSNYVGMNRGSVNTYQNIGYRFTEQKRLFLQYQNSQSKPKYLYNQVVTDNNGQVLFDSYNFYSTHGLKLGYQISKNNWNFTFSPQVEKQKNINNLINEGILSYRFRTDIGTAIKSHRINLTAEYSYSEALKTLYKFSSFKTTLSYSFKNFSLNGTAQFNPNTIYDLNYFSESSDNFINYSAYSSYNFSALQNKIKGYLSAGLYYSELYNNINQNANANIEYKITESWAATGYANYSNYQSLLANSFKGNNYQYKVGIKKYFSNGDSGSYHTINLQFFQDKNLNGILDKGENLMAEEIIKLDSYVAKTDKNGKVSFRNVPKGTYKLRVNESVGVRLMQDPEILVGKNVNLKIGLGKNNKVKGKLVEVKQTYDDLESDVRGIVVYAEDDKGQKTYTAVDQNNEFEFYLKNGSYRIFIENNKYEYVKSSQTIQLNNADYSETLLFNYVKKDRQIKVKKF